MQHQSNLSNNNFQIWIADHHRSIPNIFRQWESVRYLIHMQHHHFGFKQWKLFLSSLGKLFSIQGLVHQKNACIGLQVNWIHQYKQLIQESCQQILESLCYQYHDIEITFMHHGIDFLGYHLKCQRYYQNKFYIHVSISNQYLNRFCHEHHLGSWYNLKAQPCSFMLNRSDETIIAWFRDIFIKLMCNYEKNIIQHDKTWKQFHYFWRLSLLHSLAKKHKSSIKKIEHQFKNRLIVPRLL